MKLRCKDPMTESGKRDWPSSRSTMLTIDIAMYRKARPLGLGLWVMYQRSAYKHETLKEDRIDKLNELGFVYMRL